MSIVQSVDCEDTQLEENRCTVPSSPFSQPITAAATAAAAEGVARAAAAAAAA